jgi:hypothetical protein
VPETDDADLAVSSPSGIVVVREDGVVPERIVLGSDDGRRLRPYGDRHAFLATPAGPAARPAAVMLTAAAESPATWETT